MSHYNADRDFYNREVALTLRSIRKVSKIGSQGVTPRVAPIRSKRAATVQKVVRFIVRFMMVAVCGILGYVALVIVALCG